MRLISCKKLLVIAIIVTLGGLRPSLIKPQLESMIKVKLSADFKELSKAKEKTLLIQDLGTDYFLMMEQMTITRWPAEQMLGKNG